MEDPDRLIRFTTFPKRPDGMALEFTKTAAARLEHSDESSEALGYEVALELIEHLEDKPDSVNVLTGAVSLVLQSGIPTKGLQPLRSEPFMHGVVRGIEAKNAWYSRKGPQSLLS